MPGSARCARCGGSLALASAAIDVHPPRATFISRNFPRFWGMRQAWGRVNLRLDFPFSRLFQRFTDANFRPGTVVRALVPGWAHFHRGNLGRALLFFIGYLMLLLPAIVLAGTYTGSMLLGTAFAFHVAATSDVLVGKFATFSDRLLFTGICAAAIMFCVYVPAGWLISRVATPIQINHTLPPYQEGDVLWYSRSADLSPGDLVLYEVPRTSLHGRTEAGHAANYILRDQWINRVLAMPGQQIAWNKGLLLVDGIPSPWQPNLGFGSNYSESFVVPDDHVLIATGDLVPAGAQLDPTAWRKLSVVPRTSIQGRVYFRSLPLGRMSVLD
jgi:hypothetical protein